MDVIKHMLQARLPGSSVFLDVDDLVDVGALENYVSESQAILIFLSRGYLTSKNCLRELDYAIAQRKPLVVVHEADPSHGGVPLEVLRLEFEKHEHPSVQWCVRVVAYNKHTRQVVKATATSNNDEVYKKIEANQEEQNKERDLLKKNLSRFWSEADPQGFALIEKATKIEKEWAEASMVIDSGSANVAAEQDSNKSKEKSSS